MENANVGQHPQRKRENMAITFQVPDTVIDSVLRKMKDAHLVHPSATFNPNAECGQRREVAYRDIDFLDRIGKAEHEESIVDAAVLFLKERGIVDLASSYDKASFLRFRDYLKATFTKRSWTSLSPTMERLFYMLTSLKRPRTSIELGCFWGNTLAWFAGPCLGPVPLFIPERVYGVDINPDAIAMAKENFANVGNPQHVTILCEDARETVKRLSGPFDFVYIETKADNEDDLYLPLLKQLYDKLPKGAWIMAHDATRYTMVDEFRGYLAFVRDTQHFSESITFDIDAFGVELTIR
jgi:predicted O-methyltransferase YrrM